VRVHLAAEHALKLQLAHLAFDGRQILLDLARRGLIVFGLGELEQLGGIAYRLGGTVDLGKFGLELGTLAPELLGFFGLLPNSGIFEFAADFFEPLFLQIVFKETPLRS
jgi:hypothetical protein